MSTMYMGVPAYYSVIGPTVEAYSPLDNVIRFYGDGFQTLTGAYAPNISGVNNTGLFAIDNGGGSATVSASNPVAALELGNAGFNQANTQLAVIGSSVVVTQVASFANNGGAILEMPSGENGGFAMYSMGAAMTSMMTPFTPYMNLVDLPMDTMAIAILSQRSPAAPVAPGLSTDPTLGQMGPISPGFQGSVNYLQRPIRATSGLLNGGARENPAARFIEEITPQERDELRRELDNHLRLMGWDNPSSDVTEQSDDVLTREISPLDSVFLPPLLLELSLRDPLLVPA